MSPVADSTNYDVVVVGAGFSGVYALHQLRKQGLSVRVFEAGDEFGGVWNWNRYPGARVDSETPFYQLNIPEVWRTWNFSSRFPDHKELRRYFAHCDKVLNLRKDIDFGARVVDTKYDAVAGTWTIKTAANHVARAKYLILCTGLLHRRNYPDFPGLSEFQGVVHHSGFWPEDLSVKGKKVAIIGAGATSVQIVQELAKEADQLTMFMRRPSYCLPMKQRIFTKEEQEGWKTYYPALFKAGRQSRVGFPGAGPQIGLFDVSTEEREAYFEELWNRGAFNFQLNNYNDVITNKASSTALYEFWKKKTRARLTNPAKQELMAPDVAPYYFGTKRNPLENDYYECVNQDNVAVVNLSKTVLQTFTNTGMVMEDGTKFDFDVLVLATGFDSFTGS
jgi:cation diffusion facilitator CzcD-associated flavoprotein CzcO